MYHLLFNERQYKEGLPEKVTISQIIQWQSQYTTTDGIFSKCNDSLMGVKTQTIGIFNKNILIDSYNQHITINLFVHLI